MARSPMDMDQVFLGEKSDTLGLNFKSPKVNIEKILIASVPDIVVIAETYNTTMWLVGMYAWGTASVATITPQAWILVHGKRVQATEFLVIQRSKMLRVPAGKSVNIPQGFGVEERYPENKRVTVYLGFPLYVDGKEIRPKDIKDAEVSLHPDQVSQR